jgi:hypothetical protein
MPSDRYGKSAKAARGMARWIFLPKIWYTSFSIRVEDREVTDG